MHEPTRSPTPYVIVLGLLLIAAYDLWALHHHGPGGTISAYIRRAGTQWPLLPPLVAFAMGALYGHWFL